MSQQIPASVKTPGSRPTVGLTWQQTKHVTDKLSMTSPLNPLASNELLDCGRMVTNFAR
jgi:hypothetical protein